MAKKNYVGVVDIPVQAKMVTKDSVYDTFDREAKEKKVAWPTNANPPNTFVWMSLDNFKTELTNINLSNIAVPVVAGELAGG